MPGEFNHENLTKGEIQMSRAVLIKTAIFGLISYLCVIGIVQGVVIVPDDYPSIQTALLNAPANETLILVRPFTYFESINFLGREITVRSDADGDPDTYDPDPYNTIINGSHQASVVTFNTGETETSVLEGFTLTDGSGSGGANANGGGGVYCETASPTILGNIIYNNAAGGDGGGILSREYGHPKIINNIIYGNSSFRDGGAIACGHCYATITNNTIYGNTAAESGGGLYNWSSPVWVTNTILWGNVADTYPEIYTSPNGYTEVTYCDVAGGIAGEGNIDTDPLFVNAPGGDLHITSGSGCVDAGTNTASNIPALDFDGEDRLGNGIADIGADEYHTRVLLVPEMYATIQDAIDECQAANNDTVSVAPGVYFETIDFDGKAITVSGRDPNDRSVVERTIIDGGGNSTVVLFFNGEGPDSVLTGVTIRNGYEMWGGGIYCGGSSPTITNNLITNNVADDTGFEVGKGGGIYCGWASPVIANNVIKNNFATGNSYGGGIYCDENSSAVITNNTIVENSADWQGGGLVLESADSAVTNTIVWGNFAPADPQVSGQNADVTYCDVEGGWPGAGNIDSDPLFVDSANGDFHLTWSSPCRDGGSNGAPGLPDKDFEGDPRAALGAPDMGADEYYYHLYNADPVVPGETIRIKTVGYPSAPVTLYLGFGTEEEPMNTQYGDFWLTWPPAWYGPIGTVPQSGVLAVQVTVPAVWEEGDAYPLQALVGPPNGPWTRFTDVMTLVVE